jgi:Acetylornithine deacetylase/Succinyl-diaminopimelate desuccinylase and related deacylases
MNIEKEKVLEFAKKYEKDMTKFLRDLVKIPGESAQEEGVVKRIEQEMKALDFDKIQIDPMGNILGFIGKGEKIIGFDAHIDTVGIGNRENWDFDPYDGYETETEIGGRGTSDQVRGYRKCSIWGKDHKRTQFVK